jgi:hypothetical protein
MVQLTSTWLLIGQQMQTVRIIARQSGGPSDDMCAELSPAIEFTHRRQQLGPDVPLGIPRQQLSVSQLAHVPVPLAVVPASALQKIVSAVLRHL